MKKSPKLTVDIVIKDGNRIVLIKRKNPPYRDMYALPGGFVEYGEKVEDAAVREAKEETSLDVKLVRIIGVYSAPDRDPRGHTVAVCFLAVPTESESVPKGGDDAAHAEWFSLDALPKLAFDHEKIVRDAVQQAHTKKFKSA